MIHVGRVHGSSFPPQAPVTGQVCLLGDRSTVSGSGGSANMLPLFCRPALPASCLLQPG